MTTYVSPPGPEPEVESPSLHELVKNRDTDKDTVHSYIEVYDKIMARKRHTARNILEIGVQRGGSLLLWQDYFPTAEIYGVDVVMQNHVLNRQPRVRVVLDDAYQGRTLEFMGQRKYDIIIDDGPHSLESMLYVAHYYSKLLVEDGLLIIEDVQNIEWAPKIIESLPEELRSKAYIIDRREIKGRYDDIMVIVDLAC